MVTVASIKHRAHELGFDLCGVAPAAAFPELQHVTEWMRRGYAGDMGYLTRSAARRQDVRRVLPTARSVIVTATLYHTDRPGPADPGDPGEAIIARYARGDDYHDVIGRRLDLLLAWMREAHAEPFDAMAFVDAGPVHERVLARYAGLGWIGKNGCLIHPELGSYLFLSEIVCSLPLAPDGPLPDRCGTCTRCLDACPTGAFVDANVLDARRCLSYLTIEQHRDIPAEFHDALGRRVFGCDVCQEVCPWNQDAPRSADAAWQPRPGLDRPLLLDLWQRTDDELEALIAGTALTRANVDGLRRNFAVALRRR